MEIVRIGMALGIYAIAAISVYKLLKWGLKK